MSHIHYFRLTHPDAEKDRKDKGPSAEEVRTNAHSQVHVCSTCGEYPKGTEQLKNCAGVRPHMFIYLVYDRPFLVLHYPLLLEEMPSLRLHFCTSIRPTHKQTCAGSASSTDINLKLAKKLMANDYLMFYLKVYSVLELLTAPSNALETCLVVNLTTKDADPLAALQAMIGQQERGPGISMMLQIASIEKKPLALQTTPGMRVSLEKVKAVLADAGHGDWPVMMLVFTGDGTNCLGLPCPVDSEALRQGRELNPFVVKSTRVHAIFVTSLLRLALWKFVTLIPFCESS
ncbi:hypothetical protein C8R43DRAFT_957092 [Mycena crocata]|nr:hypothetical protein C8R43DRAFT_957092 [Mycena crocata]